MRATYLSLLPFFTASLALGAQTLPTVRPATTTLSAADEEAVRHELVTIVEDAATPQRFDQLVSQFSRVDRAVAQGEPLASADGEAAQKLDAAVAEFQKAWKAKYHQDFNLRGSEAKLFSSDFTKIELTDVTDAGVDHPPATNPAHSGVDTAPPLNPTTAPTTGPAAGRPKRRATATIAGKSPVMRFVMEGEIWKLEARSPVDRTVLQGALANHLATATADAPSWPADPVEASRAIARHVLMALPEAMAMPHDGA